ncbi:hypothetical protein ACO1ZR_26830, partial [Klebsiella quasipneumoniae]|uniref:hypothetical protein n=1 Tax=Klebsiella quasipneumoniae TaxID=1463165 RepID=UPI003BF6D7DE
RDEWSHFLPESITDLPLVARHASPSEIIIFYYLTIPFGIGSKLFAFSEDCSRKWFRKADTSRLPLG